MLHQIVREHYETFRAQAAEHRDGQGLLTCGCLAAGFARFRCAGCRHEGLHIAPDGQVVLDLRRRWADGTTQLVFDPVEFIECLAALVPRPRITLVLYYGVLAPSRGVAVGGGAGNTEHF